MATATATVTCLDGVSETAIGGNRLVVEADKSNACGDTEVEPSEWVEEEDDGDDVELGGDTVEGDRLASVDSERSCGILSDDQSKDSESTSDGQENWYTWDSLVPSRISEGNSGDVGEENV
ncbi:hypothetical protein EYR36_005639 [Pleurotus pulmonarius]|nr:hypothetical protein EYR36_005639 [Pleurotus pulmonarius]